MPLHASLTGIATSSATAEQMGGLGLGSRKSQVWPDLCEFSSCRAYERAENLGVPVELSLLIDCETDAREELLALLHIDAGAFHGLPAATNECTIDAACRDEIERGAAAAEAVGRESSRVKAQTQHDGLPRGSEKRWRALK